MTDLSVAADIPRHQEANPYNYTDLEKAQRKKALIDMKKDYDNIPDKWLEMVYDWWKHTPETEVEQIITRVN